VLLSCTVSAVTSMTSVCVSELVGAGFLPCTVVTLSTYTYHYWLAVFNPS
jgi:hypothetical protein